MNYALLVQAFPRSEINKLINAALTQQLMSSNIRKNLSTELPGRYIECVSIEKRIDDWETIIVKFESYDEHGFRETDEEYIPMEERERYKFSITMSKRTINNEVKTKSIITDGENTFETKQPWFLIQLPEDHYEYYDDDEYDELVKSSNVREFLYPTEVFHTMFIIQTERHTIGWL